MILLDLFFDSYSSRAAFEWRSGQLNRKRSMAPTPPGQFALPDVIRLTIAV